MKIENNSSYYNKILNRTIEKNVFLFENYSEKLKNANKNTEKDQFIKSNSMEFNSIGIYSKTETKMSELKFPIETERYKIELTNELEGVQAYVIRDKVLGKGLYIREDKLMIQQDIKTGMDFIINMDQPLSMNLLVTSELKSVLSDMTEKRGHELQTSSLKENLTICKDSETGLSYMTIKGNEAKGVSIVITSQKDLETINKLTQEFMKYSISSNSSTANLYALLEISGNLKREEDGFTFLTPNGVTYIPYDGNPKKAWEIEISGANIAEGLIVIWDYYNFDAASQSYQYR